MVGGALLRRTLNPSANGATCRAGGGGQPPTAGELSAWRAWAATDGLRQRRLTKLEFMRSNPRQADRTLPRAEHKPSYYQQTRRRRAPVCAYLEVHGLPHLSRAEGGREELRTRPRSVITAAAAPHEATICHRNPARGHDSSSQPRTKPRTVSTASAAPHGAANCPARLHPGRPPRPYVDMRARHAPHATASWPRESRSRRPASASRGRARTARRSYPARWPQSRAAPRA